MKINNKSRKMIVDEINFVINMMNESEEPFQKLYFFSGVQTQINRIFNQNFDEDLLFLHSVLQITHSAFVSRLNAIKGGDNTVLLFEHQIGALTNYLKELSKAIEKKEDIDDILKKYAVLSYSTTGNGYYLLQKGLLKL